MKKRKLIAIGSWIMVILWMALIFNLSSQVATDSNNLSKGITEIIVETVEKVIPNSDLTVSRLNHYVRKNAHFIAYLTLGILILNAFRRSGKKRKLFGFIALFLCFLYAISDEIHQMFIPGRGPGFLDVVIDSFGALVGIGIYVVISKLKRKNRENKRGSVCGGGF